MDGFYLKVSGLANAQNFKNWISHILCHDFLMFGWVSSSHFPTPPGFALAIHNIVLGVGNWGGVEALGTMAALIPQTYIPEQGNEHVFDVS